MPAQPRLTDLLMQWKERRLQGQTVALDELCCDSPELLDELQRQTRALEGLDPSLAGTSSFADGATVTGGSPADEHSRWPVISGYEVLSKLGEGGMGVVYKVRNLAFGRTEGDRRFEALKMLRPRTALNPLGIERFKGEMGAMARLEDPRIVRIYHAGQHENQPYFTMEYVAGGALAQHMHRFSANPEAAVALVAKVARAVHYLHSKNIVHRDLKPANILLKQEQDEPLVSDFGLAKFFDQEVEPVGTDCPGDDPRLTQTGAVMGTAAYMSPEQAAGKTNDYTPATDVWALGVILYVLLTGRQPFQGKDFESIREAIQSLQPPLPRTYQPKLGRGLEAVCLKCLQKDPRRRYQSADALANDLERLQHGELILPQSAPRRILRAVRRHPGVSTAAVLLCSFMVLVAFLLPGRRPVEPLDKTAAAEAKLAVVRAEAESGQRLTLIPALGPPSGYRWASRGIHDTVSEEADQPFSVHADDFALLELLPAHALPRYHLSIQIHHDGGAKDGEVGVYFGYSKPESAKGLPIHCFCALSFNDITAIAGRPLEQGNDLRLNPVLLYPKAPGQAAGVRRRGPPAVSTFFKPAGYQSDNWRTLELDVLPDQIRVTWDGVPLAPAPRAQLAKSVQFLLTNSPVRPVEEPQFLAQDAVGLYVYGATAWFRSCTIEALPDQQPK